MKAKQFFLMTVLLMITVIINAQTIRIDTSKHEKGTSEVIVFSKEGDKSTSPRKGHDNNVVKMGLIYFVSGNVPVYYERKIMPWLSVQAGIGLTTRDFVADIVNIVLDETQNDPYYQYQTRKAKVGVYASIQPKFYVRNEAMDGFWVGPMLEFKRYNYKAQMVDVVQSNQSSQAVYLPNTFVNEHRNAVDFTLNIGWQWLFNPLMVEFSMGGGFRRFWEVRRDISSAQYYNQFTGNTSYTYGNNTRVYGGFRPEFNMALNFGGFF